MADPFNTPLLDMDFSVEDQPVSPPVTKTTTPVVTAPEQDAPQTAGDIISGFLQDDVALDAFALAADRGNDIATEGFGRDLLELNYGQLAAKYGKDVADNRHLIQDNLSNYQLQAAATRTDGQVVGDTALGAGAGLTGLVGGLTSLGLAGIDKGVELADGPDLHLDDAAAFVADKTNDATGFIKGFQSDELQGRQRLQAVEAELDEIDRETKYGDNDDNDFIETLMRSGEEFLDAGGRILNDGAITGDVVAEAVGSLGPSAKLAKVASNLAVAGTAKVTTSVGAQKIAQTLATAASVGVSEGSGTFQQTVNAVMSLSHEDLLQTSDKYRDLIGSGLEPSEAQTRLAVDTGNEAFARQLPVAAAIGLISSKFERTPVAAFDGATIPSIARQIASQAAEEGLQGGTSQYNQNVALQNQVDEDTDLSAGIGENVATGIIAGTGMAGALASPSIAGNVVGQSLETGATTIEGVRDGVSAAANSPITSAAIDAASNIASGVVRGTQSAAGTVSDVAGPTTSRATSAAAALAEAGTRTVVGAARTTRKAVAPIVSGAADVTTAAAKQVSRPIIASGKIAFDTLKPIAQTTAEKTVQATKVGGRLTVAAAKYAGPKALTATQKVGSQFVIPAAQGGIVAGKVVLPILVQAAQTSAKVGAPVAKQLGSVSASVAMEFSAPVLRSLQTISQKPVRKELQAANARLNDVFNEIRETYGQENVGNLPEYMTDLVLTQDADLVPSEFNDVASADHSLLLNTVGILNKISSETMNYKQMSPDAVIYAATKLKQLKRAAQKSKDLRDELADVLNNPEVQKLTKLADRVDLNKVPQDTSKVNAQTTGTTLLVAKTNPTNVDPEYVRKLLNHSDRKDLSEEDIKLLTAAAEIAEAVNNHAGQQVEISKENRVALLKKPAYQANPGKLPAELDISEVSRSIQVGGFTDARGNNLRSVNDFAADIFEAAQSETGTFVNSDGIEVQMQTIVTQMGMFVTHMSNKVDALNESFDRNNDKGKGPSVGFDSLVGGQKIIKAGEKGAAKPVAYHQSSPKSAEFAAKVHNDAVVAARVYNTLLNTFPDLTGSQQEIADLRKVSTETNENTDQDTTVVEEEDAALDATADEEVADDEQPKTSPEEAGNELLQETAVRDLSALPERFQNAFTEGGAEINYTNGEDLIGQLAKVENAKEYVKFAKVLMKPLKDAMNKRLQTVKFSKKDQRSIAEVLQSDTDITAIRDFKNLLFVDPTTQTYNDDLLSIATLTAIDWLSAVRSTDPSRLSDTLEDLGVGFSQLSDQDLENIAYGVPPRQATEALAKQVLRNWNLQSNTDAPMVDTRGAVEGLVKELITVIADTKLIEINDIPTRVDGKMQTAQTINVKPMKELQKKIGAAGQGSLTKLLSPEFVTGPSIGEQLTTIDQTQSRGDVPLSKLEKAALKRMQDTPHFMSEGITALTETLGFDTISKMLGYKDLETFVGNKTLKNSVNGKNLSIERDFEEALQIIEGIRNYAENETEVPVFYPVSISKVGRHQFKGINPQNNKILRALVTPTHSILDMTSKQDQDAFWLTVAQAADLRKVENEDHQDILSTIQDQFNAEYGDAVDLVTQWLETGEIDNNALLEAMGTGIDMAQLNAVVAVAQLNFATKNNTLSEFKTTLSFELDGKTDGPANMMSNFGQGLLSKRDLSNFNRVGFFLGRKDSTLNSYFSAGNVDLYEVTSREAEREMFNRIANGSAADKNIMYAAARFASKFGDFRMEEDGSISMTRNTSKNPMTKTVYGSGVRGVGEGIADDMAIGFYSVMTSVPTGQDIEQYIGYPDMVKDIELLFGVKLDGDFNPNTFEFNETAMTRFKDVAVKGIGDILSTSAKNVIGAPIKNVNDTLVFLTNVQTQFLQTLFDQRVDALVAEQKAAGKIKSKRDLSQRDYNRIVKELSVYAPLYSNGSQQLAVGSFSGQTDPDVELSSNMDGKLRQKSTMARPDNAGVKVIPYISIGRGDAMMMNTIYGSENAPTDTLPVFDGIDMPVNRVRDYAEQINQAVMQNWDRDILSDIVNDFESFVRHVGVDADLLKASFEEVKKNVKDTTVTANNTQELLEAVKAQQEQNQARKRVFKQIPVSVDHMGGSNSAYTRGPDVDSPLGLSEINEMIQNELNVSDLDTLSKSEAYSDLHVSTAQATVKGLLRETKDTLINQTVRAIQNKLPADLKVVTGSVDQLNQYRQENFPDDGEVLKGAGALDIANNTIFLAKDGHETLAHELVHAATFDQVFQHYEGIENAAVSRLEDLMQEFMGLDFSTSSKEVRTAVNAARDAILGFQTKNDAYSKAGALNEFMAWTLTNEQLSKTLKTTRTGTIATLAKKTLNLIKRLMGGVPNDMFSNILFNTKLLDRTENNDEGIANDNNGNGDDGNGSGDVTPPADKFTNFWIDLVRERIVATQDSLTPLTDRRRLKDYKDTASDIVTQLDFGGFSLNEYQKQTFKAIHVVLATEMRLDTQSALAMGRVYDYVTDNLTPEMLGPVNAEQRYSTVMELLGSSKNEEGVSDAIAVLLALSQTSKGFRAALDQLPEPEGEGINAGTLNEFLTTSTGFLMRKAVGSIDVSDASVKDTLDNLSENLIRQDNEKDFALLRGVMKTINKADKFTSGAMSEVAERADQLDRAVRDSDRSKVTKVVVGSVALVTAFLDETRGDLATKAVKDVTHMGTALDNFVPVREFVSEVVGTDKTNSETVALLDRTNHAVSSVRQAYRESLPVILQNEFTNHPDETQWKTLHRVLGKGDFSALFNLRKPKESMRLISQPGFLNKKVQDAENAIRSNFSKTVAGDILQKAQQLADYMNGNGAGHQLIRNAYAINKLAGEFDSTMTSEIDALISMYALQGMDVADKESITDMYKNDPKAVTNLIVYQQGLNREEDLKVISESAKLNGYKGYIPDHPAEGSRLVIEDDAKQADLEKMGFTRIGDYTAENYFSSVKRGYYFTTVKQGGAYSQGVLQSVQDSYRGVDSNSGLSVNGMVSGIISGESANVVTTEMNKITSIKDNKSALIPVYDNDGAVLHYERAISPDVFESHMNPRSNLALMLGSWAGRQVEEKFAQRYNNELIDQLKGIYDNRKPGSDNLYVDLSDKNLKDEVFKDTWRVIPPQTKEYIETVFGEEGFFVRKDMVNLALGYRDPSVLDIWTGKTRLPESVQETVKSVSKMLMGDKAVAMLSRAEEGVQGVVSTAKDLIVVRSLIVPYMNAQANMMQLSTRGVGAKDTIRGTREKLAEIEAYNGNVTKLIELETQIQLAATDKNRVAVLESQIQTVKDQNARMSIAPLIEAGAYKNISEGITELDVQLTSGRMGEWVENQLNKLPAGVQTVAKYGIMSKDTALYKGANKAVQYGDFIAKSILYDHYVAREGMDPTKAMERINEEFVNFSVLPGRTRQYLEGLGATWFLTFKIRIMKTALKIMRDNPVRALITAGTVGDLGSPVNDNLVSVLAQDRLDYSLGWDMLFGSPELNPWVQLADWADQ